MRVFVSLHETVHSLDVDVRETVSDIKNTLRERFGLNLKNCRNETDQFVSLVYQGSSLQDNLVYSDLGIPAGSTLVCRVNKQVEPSIIVHCINYDEMIEYTKSFNVWDTLVGTLRGMIQDSTGIHVSAFRLYSKSGLELFDCHPFKVYGIDTGDTVTMEIWRDVADVLHAARDNDITDTLGSLVSFHDGPHLLRYQLQLGLFTAAHFGYHQLATQLMKCGARPDEPVGQHPSRDWCRASAHVDHVKTPAHEAAQHGRLKCLQHFLMFNYAVLICKDAHGLTPCNIARRHKQRECFKLLVAEQFRIPSVHPELSIHVYSRVRKWCDRARMRARLHKDKTAMLLLTNAELALQCAVVGQRVEVDGFNGLGDRKVKSTPSSLNPNNEKIIVNHKPHSATFRGNLQNNQHNTSSKKIHTKSHSVSRALSHGNVQSNRWATPVSRGKAALRSSSNPLPHENEEANHWANPVTHAKAGLNQVSHGNAEANHWANPVSHANAEFNPVSHGNAEAKHSSKTSAEETFTVVKKTKSAGVPSQGNSKSNQSNSTLSSNLHDTSYMNGKSSHDKSKRQSSNIRQKSLELYRRPKIQSARGVYSVTSPNTTPDQKAPSTSSFVTPRAGHPKSRDSTCGGHDVSLAWETHREQALAELGKSGERQNSRYIWKSLDDDMSTENQENRRISMDKRSQTRTPVIDDQLDPVKSNDTPNNNGEISAKSRWKLIRGYREINGSTVNNTGEKHISQDDRPVLSRDKIGDCRQDVTTREACNARKGVTPSKPGSTFEHSHQANNPVKRRSAKSRVQYQGSVESNADKCLRVACETFRKKSWLGQLQMALVVNTNMCKRR